MTQLRLSVVASVRTGGLEYSGDAMSPRPIASYPLHLRAPQHVPLGHNFDFPFRARGSKRVIFSFSPILSTALSSLSRASTRRAEPDEATRGKRASCLTSIGNPFPLLSHPSAERRRGKCASYLTSIGNPCSFSSLSRASTRRAEPDEATRVLFSYFL